MKMFIVTRVNYSMDNDGKAKVVGVYKTAELAKTAVKQDIDNYINKMKSFGWDEEYLDLDYENMSVDFATEHGGEWNIEEVEIPE